GNEPEPSLGRARGRGTLARRRASTALPTRRSGAGPAPTNSIVMGQSAAPSARRGWMFGGSLQPLFQSSHVRRHLRAGLTANDQWHEELADPMPAEVKLDCDP